MTSFRLLSAAEQVAARLREDLLGRRYVETVPGVHRLAEEFGVHRKTADDALKLLEKEGLLAGQGPGRRRKVALTEEWTAPRGLRVAILAGEVSDRRLDYMVEAMHKMGDGRHTVFHAPLTMKELGEGTDRFARMFEKTEADAWIVLGGSREILEWFSDRGVPALAVFGRRRGLPIAGVGPDKPVAYVAAAQALVKLGHRRIVLLARKFRRLPEPGESERTFLRELEAQGLDVGPYNLPDWEENIDGFHGCLTSLFSHSPPTALIVDEVPFFVATQQFLMNMGFRVPGDVSLICTDADPAFAWCKPSVAHIRWDSRRVVQRIVRWADNVSLGKNDLRQTLTKAEFVEGGTVGPVIGLK